MPGSLRASAPLKAATTRPSPTWLSLTHGRLARRCEVARAESQTGNATNDPSRSKQPPATPAPLFLSGVETARCDIRPERFELARVPKANRFRRRPYNVLPLTCGTREPTIAPSARGARERGPVSSGAAAVRPLIGAQMLICVLRRSDACPQRRHYSYVTPSTPDALNYAGGEPNADVSNTTCS